MCRWYLPGDGGHDLVTGFQGMALNGLFCADVLRPLDLVPLTDFTYKYHPADKTHCPVSVQQGLFIKSPVTRARSMDW